MFFYGIGRNDQSIVGVCIGTLKFAFEQNLKTHFPHTIKVATLRRAWSARGTLCRIYQTPEPYRVLPFQKPALGQQRRGMAIMRGDDRRHLQRRDAAIRDHRAAMDITMPGRLRRAKNDGSHGVGQSAGKPDRVEIKSEEVVHIYQLKRADIVAAQPRSRRHASLLRAPRARWSRHAAAPAPRPASIVQAASPGAPRLAC